MATNLRKAAAEVLAEWDRESQEQLDRAGPGHALREDTAGIRWLRQAVESEPEQTPENLLQREHASAPAPPGPSLTP